MKKTAVEWLLQQWMDPKVEMTHELFEQAKQMDSEQTISKMETIRKNGIVELSDEEIIKASERENHYENSIYHRYNAFREGWINAIKWYREQLKQRQ